MTDRLPIKRSCAYNNFPEFPCPAEDAEYFAMRETCKPGEYGTRCGSYVVQKLILETIDIKDLSSTLDILYGPITGHAQVIEVPQGDIEEHTRSSIVGTSFPLREQRSTDLQAVAVLHADLIFTLLQKGKMDHANAYSRYRFNAAVAGAELEWWYFNSDEVEITEYALPVTTMNHYDDTYDMHSLAAGNNLTTLFGLARIANIDYRPTISEWLTLGAKSVETVELPE